MEYTLDWDRLGDVYYRKKELYSMSWDKSDLSLYFIAVASYGGPIALLRDASKGPPTTSTSMPILYIYNSCGKLLAQTTWSSGKVIFIGWSTNEEILCVQDEGSVLVYDIFGKFQRVFNMGSIVKETRAIHAKIFNCLSNTGLAVMTSQFRIFLVNNVDDPQRLRHMADIRDIHSVPIWTILSTDRGSMAIVAKDSDIFFLEYNGSKATSVQFDSVNEKKWKLIIAIAVSFNQQLIAIFDNTGYIWIGQKDLKITIAEFQTGKRTRPRHLEFCGNSAILCSFQDEMYLYDFQTHDEFVTYALDEPVYCSQELDGIRILSSFSHDFLHRIDPVLQTAYLLSGTMEAHNQLIEAYQQFKNMSPKADEYLKNIGDKLLQAVSDCIKCAQLEYDVNQQKLLLGSASFGKTFLNEHDPSDFLKSCQNLRILNAVRRSTIGIGISYKQFLNLTLPVLLDRLILRRQFALAIKICEFLRSTTEKERIFGLWAKYKLNQKQSDDIIADCIVEKLGRDYMAYSDIAQKALDVDRNDLAARLLEFEPRSTKQVPMLLKMKRNELALMKSLESGDVDLIFQALLHLKDNMSQVDFIQMLTKKSSQAFSYYIQFCKENNRSILKDLYSVQDNFLQIGHHLIMDSFERNDFQERIENLKEAIKYFQKARNDWLAKQVEEEIKLLEYQSRLEKDFSRSYIDLSLHKTIAKLIQEDRTKLAEQLRKDFKIGEKTFYYIKIEALAEADKWIELEEFSKSKKSPVGYEPFLETCTKYSNLIEAEKYITKISIEDRPRFLYDIGKHDEAVKLAFQNKDLEELERLSRICVTTNKSLYENIRGLILQLRGNK